jgi:hypothetical protein
MFLGWFSRGGDEAILNELSPRADSNFQGSISRALNNDNLMIVQSF